MVRGWWRLRDEGLWRILLVANVQNENTETVSVSKPPSSFSADSKQPHTDKLLNAYKMKTRPELVRFYHAAAGFPTKSTWLAAIKNKHYASWVGLNAFLVAKHFPESE